MPEAKIKLEKRQIQAIIGVFFMVLVLTLLVFSYPWLQLQLALRMISSGNYEQAEQVLVRLVESRPDWTTPRKSLVMSQLHLGKGQEAASTVISLADRSSLQDIELAIIFMDVAEHLINTGHGEAALELTNRVLAQRQDKMLVQATVETGFLIAELYNLPLALDALTVSLSHSEDNWILSRKAFNILLTKALEAPAHLAEPALDKALEIYPNNIIAVTRKANLLGDRLGAKHALDFLVQREPDLQASSFSQEYIETKRRLIIRLGNTEPTADLTLYVGGMEPEMVQEIAIYGLNQAWRQGQAGTQYYELAQNSPDAVYIYGRNLYQLKRWQEARQVFTHLRQLEPGHMNFNGLFAALNSHLNTNTEVLNHPNFSPDLAQVSPDGTWLALRQWGEMPRIDEYASDLLLRNLTNGSERSLGETMYFHWSPDGKYLAYLSTSSTGLGRLYIYSVEDTMRYSLPSGYDVIDFNWAGNNLMVQALYHNQIRLIRLSSGDWQVLDNIEWDLNSAVNQDFAWLTISDRTLVINTNQQQPKEFRLPNRLTAFSNWSPNGRLAVVEDEKGNGWIYNHLRGDLTQINTPGTFAAWGGEQEIYWYLPVWERLYVLVRLNSNGNVQEYLPYSFSVPVYDISVAAGARILAHVGDSRVNISRR